MTEDLDLDRLERLKRLREDGTLTDSEFEHQKQLILSSASGTKHQQRPIVFALILMASLMVFAALAFTISRSQDSGSSEQAQSDPVKNTIELAPSLNSSSPSAEPEAQQKPSSENLLRFATSEDVIGMNPTYLEQKLGVPRDKSRFSMTYELGGCALTYTLKDSEIRGVWLDITRTCSVSVRGSVIRPTTTFGEILMKQSGGRFHASCLTSCGNAADPVIDLDYPGSRVTQFISVRYSTGYDQASDALSIWESDVRRREGLGEFEFPTSSEPFNCVTGPPQSAQRMMMRMQVRSVQISNDNDVTC